MNKSPLVLTKNCPVLLSSFNRQQYLHYVSDNQNNLMAEASKIFAIIAQFKNKTSKNIKKLQKLLFREIEIFEGKIKILGFDEDCVFACSYALNSCVEELFTIYSDSKKRPENVSQRSLDVKITDRERFFIILDKICKEPKKFIDVIELIYICLILGFDSQLKNYSNMILTIDCIYQIIRSERGEVEKKLSFLESYRNSFKSTRTKPLFFTVFKILFVSLIIMGGMYICTYYLFEIFSEQIEKNLIVDNLSYVQTDKKVVGLEHEI